jgi:hypothetical protein
MRWSGNEMNYWPYVDGQENLLNTWSDCLLRHKVLQYTGSP